METTYTLPIDTPIVINFTVKGAADAGAAVLNAVRFAEKHGGWIASDYSGCYTLHDGYLVMWFSNHHTITMITSAMQGFVQNPHAEIGIATHGVWSRILANHPA